MEYVSFDTAKLLKEKGYPRCEKAAPTIYEAMQWLKVNHDIDIDTDTVWGMDKVITYYVKGYRFQLHSPIFPNYDVNEVFRTREIAYDEAIKKCLTDLI
jgi:hypothetical protein